MLEFLTKFVAFVDNLFSRLVVNFVVAVLILLFGFAVGKLLGKLVHRLLHEAEVDKVLRKLGFRVSLGVIVGTVTSYLIYLVAVILALDQFGLAKGVFGVLSLVLLFLLVLFLVITLVDFVPNFFAGLFLRHRDVFGVGDFVSFKNFEGRVSRLGVIDLELVTRKKDVVHVPNTVVLKSRLVVKKARIKKL